MKIVRRLLLSILLAMSLLACSKERQRPNILLFLVDDYGWIESSLAFGEQVYPMNECYHTPNIEALASQGVMMTSAYACPASTPTRTSIMTGMSASRMGITSFTSLYKDICPDAADSSCGYANPNLTDVFEHPEWNYNALCPEQFADQVERYGLNRHVVATPMVKLLRDAGYYTIHVGKADWAPAGMPGANPYNMGFMVSIADTDNQEVGRYQSEDNGSNNSYTSVQNMAQYYGTDIHLTEALTMEAIKSLETPIARKEPFFLYLGHYADSTPIGSCEKYYKKYLNSGFDPQFSAYAAMVESVDASLGEILSYLDSKGVADNTIVIFYSDNGGKNHTQNLPLRAGKASVYEGGIRVPMIIRWPGKVVADTRINTPVNNEDIFPTILEMAEIDDYKIQQELDGRSLVRLFTAGSKYVATAQQRGLITTQREANRFVVPKSVSGIDPQRPIVAHYPHQYCVEDTPDIDFMSAVRVGDWKLVYRMHEAELELYNLRDDIGERNNLAASMPEKRDELATTLSKKLREWDAPMPTIRATAERVPMPDEL